MTTTDTKPARKYLSLTAAAHRLTRLYCYPVRAGDVEKLIANGELRELPKMNFPGAKTKVALESVEALEARVMATREGRSAAASKATPPPAAVDPWPEVVDICRKAFHAKQAGHEACLTCTDGYMRRGEKKAAQTG